MPSVGYGICRRKQLGSLRFRRQQPIGPYVVDFFCSAAKLIVELDGDQHGADKNIAYDADRTAWLEKHGYKVLRFANRETLNDALTDAIWYEAEKRLPLPERPSAVRPSLKGRVD
jgi:very-short-patch-repair endonuclease